MFRGLRVSPSWTGSHPGLFLSRHSGIAAGSWATCLLLATSRLHPMPASMGWPGTLCHGEQPCSSWQRRGACDPVTGRRTGDRASLPGKTTPPSGPQRCPGTLSEHRLSVPPRTKLELQEWAVAACIPSKGLGCFLPQTNLGDSGLGELGPC